MTSDDPRFVSPNGTLDALSAAGRAANDADMIVALDPHGVPYPIDKWQAHVDNVPHLAVSVFVFWNGQLLLQRRALQKYHSGGLWANTCCTHPRWRESPLDCARRRLSEELGIDLPLRRFGRIDYQAAVGPAPVRPDGAPIELFENERVQCYVGHVQGPSMDADPDPLEVQDMQWRDLLELAGDVRAHPLRYTAWLRIYLARHLSMLKVVATPSDTLTS